MVAFTMPFYLSIFVLLLFAMLGFIIGSVLSQGDPVATILGFLVFGFIGTLGFQIIFGTVKAIYQLMIGG